MLQLNVPLREAGIDPATTVVVRHRPVETAFHKIMPWIAAERPDLFVTYQQIQWSKLETAMTKARTMVAFLGHESKKALFVGIYEIRGHRRITFEEYWDIAGNVELKGLGMTGLQPTAPAPLLFDLALQPHLEDWKGKLVVSWPGLERSWWRWADRNVIPIAAITEESRLVEAMPGWDQLAFAWNQLAALPTSWKAALSQWRGVYFIFDVARCQGYVGSAYGIDNILGRWRNYASSGHGGNRQLRSSNPNDLRFTILQRTSPDLEAAEVIRLEAKWKDRLHTREYGLNEN